MPDATAMAVRDGVVAWLGNDDVGRAQFPDAEIVDLEGAFVAPAFVDSHVHLTATGLTLAGLDLRSATSLRHCLALIADYVRAHPDGPIWAHGWDESGWPENTAPSTDDLDGCRLRSTRLPCPRRCALRGGLDRTAPTRAGSGRRGGFRSAAASRPATPTTWCARPRATG